MRDPLGRRVTKLAENIREAICARHAARRMTAEEGQALAQSCKACEAVAGSGDPDAYLHAIERFHELIALGSKNQFRYERALLRKPRMGNRREGSPQEPQEHWRFAEAIGNGLDEEVVGPIGERVRVQGEGFSDLPAGLRSLPATSRLRRRQPAGPEEPFKDKLGARGANQ